MLNAQSGRQQWIGIRIDLDTYDDATRFRQTIEGVGGGCVKSDVVMVKLLVSKGLGPTRDAERSRLI